MDLHNYVHDVDRRGIVDFGDHPYDAFKKILVVLN